MNARQAWAEFLLTLELERRKPLPERLPQHLEPITPEQAAENQQTLLDALSGDPVVVAWREGKGARMRGALTRRDLPKSARMGSGPEGASTPHPALTRPTRVAEQRS